MSMEVFFKFGYNEITHSLLILKVFTLRIRYRIYVKQQCYRWTFLKGLYDEDDAFIVWYPETLNLLTSNYRTMKIYSHVWFSVHNIDRKFITSMNAAKTNKKRCFQLINLFDK